MVRPGVFSREDGEVANLEVSPGSRQMLRRILEQPGRMKHDRLGLNHAVAVLLESWPGLAKDVASGLNPDAAWKASLEELHQGRIGQDLTEERLVEAASRWAEKRGKERVFERDIAAAVFEMAGYQILETVAEEPARPPAPAGSTRPEATGTQAPPASTADPSPGKVPRPSVAWHARAKRPTPILEQLARDLTAEAAEGRLYPVLGRADEIRSVIETLLRERKPNPLLLGPAGVGKTAVVEGLAQAVVEGRVPEDLRGVRVFALQVTDLVQGMRFVGDIEQRMKQLVSEAEQDGVIVFLDEIHAAIGTGAGQGHNDVANILKPALGRGLIMCIGATTREEYERFLKNDSAFERRFQTVAVQELGVAETREILRGLAARAGERHNVAVGDSAIECVLRLSDEFMRNRYRPDKAIDVFDQVVARARLDGAREVTEGMVRDVVSRMVGMPVEEGGLGNRLDGLRGALLERAGCDSGVAERVAKRLSVTMRGMDMARHRPNAVLLVLVESQTQADALARTLADTLFGEDAPVVTVDMSGWGHPADVNWLTGAPPGYVGHDVPLSFLMALSQRPWSVVHFVRPDLAHPVVQTALGNALRCGYLRDSRGRNVFLSDAVVVLSVQTQGGAGGRHVGFRVGGEASRLHDGTREAAMGLVGRDIAECVDLVVRPVGGKALVDETWVRDGLRRLSERWAAEGYPKVFWDDTVARWVVERAGREHMGRDEVLAFVENDVVPAVVARMEGVPPGLMVTVAVRDGAVAVERPEPS